MIAIGIGIENMICKSVDKDKRKGKARNDLRMRKVGMQQM